MCGIAGRILREPGNVGHDLTALMAAQRHRGADSTGFALYGAPLSGAYRVKVHLEDRLGAAESIAEMRKILKSAGSDLVEEPTLNRATTRHATARLTISDPSSEIADWVVACEQVPGIEILSVGRALEIVKDDGDALQVAERHQMGEFVGTHGLGHARLATESSVSPIASHPFWARPFPDVAIVHNGQLTNYFLSKRRLEHKGYRFATENDSELIAVWVSDQMKAGANLEEALTKSVTSLDGVFTYLIATINQVGMAKDRLAIKPIVAVETDGSAAMATEEQALRRIYHDEAEVINYDGPGLVRVWNVEVPAGVA